MYLAFGASSVRFEPLGPCRESYGFDEYTGEVMEWRLVNIAVHPHHRHTQPCASMLQPCMHAWQDTLVSLHAVNAFGSGMSG